jgi:glycosyltransferase involved in cell wall biosynthesis
MNQKQKSGLSVCLTLRNRSNLFKYCLESLSRQTAVLQDIFPIEICVADGYSTDNLITLIDRYSDAFTFKYAMSDRNKASFPISSNMPCADLNAMIKWMPSYDTVVKMDPEVVLRDDWVLEEIHEYVEAEPRRLFNARTHFTEGNDWYHSYEDIINDYEQHYHYAEGGPFSRSKFYFCSGFNRLNFIELGGIEEMFSMGTGYEDTHFREVWKNHYGSYEREITGQAIHLWHGHNVSPPSWEELNRRVFEYLKNSNENNRARIQNGNLLNKEDTIWGSPDMLSKIYIIHDGEIVGIHPHPAKNPEELDLPF